MVCERRCLQRRRQQLYTHLPSSIYSWCRGLSSGAAPVISVCRNALNFSRGACAAGSKYWASARAQTLAKSSSARRSRVPLARTRGSIEAPALQNQFNCARTELAHPGCSTSTASVPLQALLIRDAAAIVGCWTYLYASTDHGVVRLLFLDGGVL